MKKILLACSIAALFVAAKNIPSRAKDCALLTYTANGNDGYLIRKENIADNIRKITGESTSADFKIKGDSNGNAYVEVFAKANNKNLSREETQKILNEKYVLEIQQSNGELRLTAKRKSAFAWSLNNSDNINLVFNVHVPSRVATTITTTSGDVQLYGLEGDQQFRGTSGDIFAEKITGNISIVTTSGDASLTDINGTAFSFDGTSGDLNLANGQFRHLKTTTSSGDISIHNVSSNVTANSASGDLRIVLKQGSLQASSASGDQHIEIKNPTDFIRTRSGSGDVLVRVPGSVGADVDVKGGSVSMSSKSKFAGDISKERGAVGKWNGGGIPIEIKTGSGDINLDWN